MKYSTTLNLYQIHLFNTVLAPYFKETIRGKEKSFKITNDDAIVLDFIRDLFPKQNMEKIMINDPSDKENHGMIFVWVNYKNMMEQLPTVSLGRDHIYSQKNPDKIEKRQTYSKICSDRISKLVKCGLVYKISIKDDGGKGGEKVYLAPTELSEMLYEKVENNSDNIEEVIDEKFKGCLIKSSKGCLIKSSNLYMKIFEKDINTKGNNKRKKINAKEKKEFVNEVPSHKNSTPKSARVSDTKFRQLLSELELGIKSKSKITNLIDNLKGIDQVKAEKAYQAYQSIQDSNLEIIRNYKKLEDLYIEQNKIMMLPRIENFLLDYELKKLELTQITSRGQQPQESSYDRELRERREAILNQNNYQSDTEIIETTIEFTGDRNDY